MLSGEQIFEHTAQNQTYRDRVIKALNEGRIDGMVMTGQVGGYGHNLVGANHIIFLGSSYSQAGENQAVGNVFHDSG